MAIRYIQHKEQWYLCGFYTPTCYLSQPMINFDKIEVPGENGKRFFSAQVVGESPVWQEKLLKELLEKCLEKEKMEK